MFPFHCCRSDWFSCSIGKLGLILVLTLLVGCQSSTEIEERGLKPAPQEFKNNYPHDAHGFGDFLKWQWERFGETVKTKTFDIFPDAVKRSQAVPEAVPSITWIGHSTFLLKYKGTTILTDPHLTARASPVSFAGPIRYTPPALSFDDLPPIDFVVISHNHYDHLDLQTVVRLTERQAEHPLHFFVPLGIKAWFEDLGIESVSELNWWQHEQLGAWEVHAVPVQHFSGRSLFDRNKTLWAGWVLKHPEFNFFFAGDTGYSKDFKEIGKRLGPFDLSAIPIGAYKPRWFMKAMHVNPEEAVQIHLDTRSRFSVGMHWGTFVLTDEPMEEPPIALAKARRALGVDDDEFVIMQHGETQNLHFLMH